MLAGPGESFSLPNNLLLYDYVFQNSTDQDLMNSDLVFADSGAQATAVEKNAITILAFRFNEREREMYSFTNCNRSTGICFKKALRMSIDCKYVNFF